MAAGFNPVNSSLVGIGKNLADISAEKEVRRAVVAGRQ
jgi:hypothetical protein